MYEDFALKTGNKPWPVQERVVVGFLKFCGRMYSWKSITDVIAASIKRLNIDKCNVAVSDTIRVAMATVLRMLRKEYGDQGSRNRHALLHQDAVHIIRCMPSWLTSRAAEASLLLFATGCGARGITCADVRLCDVRPLVCEGSEQSALNEEQSTTVTCFVVVRQRTTKGQRNWNHETTFEGSPFDDSAENFVYWLRLHIWEAFGLAWDPFCKLAADRKLPDAKLWKWSSVAMNAMLVSRAKLAGYPEKMFTFHSCRKGTLSCAIDEVSMQCEVAIVCTAMCLWQRVQAMPTSNTILGCNCVALLVAGFICSAILENNTQSDSGMLETTAHVAGWLPGGTAQLRYVGENCKRTIVCTRLVRSATTKVSPIAAELCSIPAYHNLPGLPESRWGLRRCRSIPARKEVMDAIKGHTWPSTALLPHLRHRRVYRFVSLQFAKQTPGLSEAALQLAMRRHDDDGKSVHKHLPECLLLLGAQHMCDSVIFGVKTWTDIVSELVRYIPLWVECAKPHKRKRSDATVPREITFGARRRIFWSPHELAVLLHSFSIVGHAAAIIQRALPRRTCVDVKDKLRNLKLNGSSVQAVFRDLASKYLPMGQTEWSQMQILLFGESVSLASAEERPSGSADYIISTHSSMVGGAAVVENENTSHQVLLTGSTGRAQGLSTVDTAVTILRLG